MLGTLARLVLLQKRRLAQVSVGLVDKLRATKRSLPNAQLLERLPIQGGTPLNRSKPLSDTAIMLGLHALDLMVHILGAYLSSLVLGAFRQIHQLAHPAREYRILPVALQYIVRGALHGRQMEIRA